MKNTPINLLRSPIAASRARSLLAYLSDMSRRSLRGSLHSGLLATIYRGVLKKLGLLALLALLPTLQGCFPVIATGVGVGAAMIDDRRSSGTYIDDEGIELKAFHRLDEKFHNTVHINTSSFNRRALLTGEVTEQAAKDEAEKIVRGIPNVKGVINELAVAGLSSMAERSNDTYVTSKVKMRCIESGRVSINHVKVVTENGVVYLMGMVTRREADDATEITRSTSGVRKVVKLFEYMD